MAPTTFSEPSSPASETIDSADRTRREDNSNTARTVATQGTRQSRSWVSIKPTTIAFITMSVIIGATAFGAYRSSLGIGFLLDDFSHLDYGYRISQGDWSGLVKVFTSNWTGAADDLTSYRPLISISMLLDYLVWGINAMGYHLTNIAMFTGCSILTGLLGYELSNNYRTSTRFAIAFASALLFTVYPLHPESVAWIIGRVDVQCSLFYLLSTYLYFISRRTSRKSLLVASLCSFALALPSKEMAVTLPACLVLAELLVLDTAGLKLKQKLRETAPFWLMLGAFAVVRTCAIGTLVGGYGESNLKATIAALKNFLDVETWKKVFMGVNEEVQFPGNVLALGHRIMFALGAIAIVRLGERANYWRTLAFLALWAVVAELPTFQIWHVYPNLSGSRLLFIPSTPLCIALAYLAIPAISRTVTNIPATVRMFVSSVGTMLIVGLAFVWFQALQANLEPWNNAGLRMTQLQNQIHTIANETPEGKKSLLIDLPQDYSGAGLLGRPEFLERQLRPPVFATDKREKILTCERPIAGSHEYISHETVQEMTNARDVSKSYVYDSQQAKYVAWQQPKNGSETFDWSGAVASDGGTASGDNASARWDEKTSVYWLPECNLNPFETSAIIVSLPENIDKQNYARNTHLTWKSKNQPQSWRDYSVGPNGEVIEGKVVFSPRNLREWLLNGTITQLGFSCADKTTSPISVTTSNGSEYFPATRIERIDSFKNTNTTSSNNELASLAASAAHPLALRVPGTKDYWAMGKTNESMIQLRWDVSKIIGAKGVMLAVTKSGASFYDFPTNAFPYKKRIAYKKQFETVTGQITLPDSAFAGKGMHQVGVVALDSNDKPIAFVSEPRTIEVR